MPEWDRIDLHVEVQPVSAADLVLPPPAEGSAEVAARVAAARAVQRDRYAGETARTNAEADGPLLDAHATPDEPGRALLAQAAAQIRLTARGYTRVLRVARTIADLAGAATVGRTRLYPRAPGSAHDRGPGGRGDGGPHPRGGGAELPPPGAAQLMAGGAHLRTFARSIRLGL